MSSTIALTNHNSRLTKREDAVGYSLSSVIGMMLLIVAVNLTTFNFITDIENQQFSVDWQTALRLCVCAACGLYGFAYLPCTLSELLRFPGAWATLFGLWGIATIPFSVSPMYATAGVFALGCVTLFAPAVLVQLGGRKTVETLLTGLFVFVGLNWFLYFAFPPLARSAFNKPDGEVIYRFGNDAQQLGLQIAWALGFLLILTLTRSRRWRSSFIPFVVLFATLPLTQSRTAILSSIATLGVVSWQHMKGPQRALAVLGILLLGVSAVAIIGSDARKLDIDFAARVISRSGEAEEIYNLTGRNVIWEHAWARICESPVVGWGYGCSRFAMDDNELLFRPRINHAHNLVLNVWLCMGFPGALLLLAMFGHQFLRMLWRPSIVPSIAVAFVIVASISEPVLFGPMPRSHTVIWLIALFWQQIGERWTDDKNLSLEL